MTLARLDEVLGDAVAAGRGVGAFTTALRRHLADDPDVVDTRSYLGAARDPVGTEAARLIELLALRRVNADYIRKS